MCIRDRGTASEQFASDLGKSGTGSQQIVEQQDVAATDGGFVKMEIVGLVLVMLSLVLFPVTGNEMCIRDRGSIIHKAAPLWEMIRINIPRSELKGMASMPPEKWGGISDERIEKLIEAVEQAVGKAKKIKEKTYGNRIGSGR